MIGVSMVEFPDINEERNVITALQSGDAEAAGILYEWFGVTLYRQVILSRLPVEHQAEDVLRDTFRIAFERIAQYSVRDRSIYFWLRRIAINLVIDTYRKQTRNRALAERLLANDAVALTVSLQPTAPDQGLIDQDARQMINDSLELINPRYATALRLRLLEDLSRQECAARLDVSVSTFDVLFHRACKAFREHYPP